MKKVFAISLTVILLSFGNVAFASTTINGTQPLVLDADGGATKIPNLDNILFADTFSGVDVTAKILTAINSSPSVNPVIYVTQNGNFSTVLNLPAGKYPTIICAGVSQLNYTGTGTSTIVNVGTGSKYTWGIYNCPFNGNGSGQGIQIGGNLGADSFTLWGTQYTNFTNAVTAGANVNWFHMDYNTLKFNVKDFLWLGGANSGENEDISGNTFADCAPSPLKCFEIRGGMSTLHMGEPNSFDDAQAYVSVAGIENSEWKCFFENPQALSDLTYAGYPMLVIVNSYSGQYNIKECEFTQDAMSATSSFKSAIQTGDRLDLDGVTFIKIGTYGWTNAVESTNGTYSIPSTRNIFNDNAAFTNLLLIGTTTYPNTDIVPGTLTLPQFASTSNPCVTVNALGTLGTMPCTTGIQSASFSVSGCGTGSSVTGSMNQDGSMWGAIFVATSTPSCRLIYPAPLNFKPSCIEVGAGANPLIIRKQTITTTSTLMSDIINIPSNTEIDFRCDPNQN